MHVLQNGLETASPDWIMSSRTSETLATNFRKRWPRLMAELPNLCFMEQYDPAATVRSGHKFDFAFVADQVKECGLSIDAAALTRMGAPDEADDSGALGALRDNLSKGAEIGWWIVYNGDVEREDLGSGDDEAEKGEDEGEDKEKKGVEMETTGKEAAVVVENAYAETK